MSQLTNKSANQILGTPNKQAANEWICKKCNSKFKEKRYLQTHLKGPCADNRKLVTCDHPGCGKQLTNLRNLEYHKKTVHSQVRSFVCTYPCVKNPNEQCKKAYKHKSDLFRHHRVHKGTAFQCPGCSSEFNHKGNFKKHFSEVVNRCSWSTTWHEMTKDRKNDYKKWEINDILKELGRRFGRNDISIETCCNKERKKQEVSQIFSSTSAYLTNTISNIALPTLPNSSPVCSPLQPVSPNYNLCTNNNGSPGFVKKDFKNDSLESNLFSDSSSPEMITIRRKRPMSSMAYGNNLVERDNNSIKEEAPERDSGLVPMTKYSSSILKLLAYPQTPKREVSDSPIHINQLGTSCVGTISTSGFASHDSDYNESSNKNHGSFDDSFYASKRARRAERMNEDPRVRMFMESDEDKIMELFD